MGVFLGVVGIEGPFLVIDQDVEAGHPEIPCGFVFGPQLVDALLGDEFELEGCDQFDVFDLLHGDGLLHLFQRLVGVVAQALFQDQEVSSLPDGQQS